jgi:hypothetical protein
MKPVYRFRERTDTYKRFARSGLTLNEALEFARKSRCPVIETLGSEFRWVPVTARIVVREQGQRFATYASLMIGRKCVATTDDVPFGMSARARELAEQEAVRLGLEVSA